MPLPQAPALTLAKQGVLDTTVVAPANRADVGDKVNYTLTATNAGNVTLTGVTIVDPKLGTLVCTPPQPATLAPGAQIVCTGSYTLTQADLDAGQVAEHGDGATATRRRRRRTGETVPLPQAPALTLAKHGALDMTVVAPANRADVGDMVNYTLTATNVGNVTLTGVTIVDPKLGALVCTPPQPATLAPGATARLHGQLHADAGRPQRRPGREHGDGRQRPDAADGRDRDGAAAAGAGADARQGRDARHDGRRADATAPTSATRSTTR